MDIINIESHLSLEYNKPNTTLGAAALKYF